jgi:Ser/Thr protein kinase RdoA (MazF antagonist)
MSSNSLPETLLARILQLYGITDFTLAAVNGGYRNVSHHLSTSQGELNLMLYKSEPGIVERVRRVDALGDHLATAGLPVRTRYDTRIITLHGRSTRYAGLYYFVPGATIPWEAYTMKHIKLLGWALGDMHDAARDFDGTLPSVIDEYRAILTRIERYLSRPDIVTALADKCQLRLSPHALADCAKLLDASALLPDQQPLHMDFVRGNVLFSDQPVSRYQLGTVTLSGIIDLEKAAYGPRIFDLARTLAFLYADCDSKPADKIYKYFIESGYMKRGNGVCEPAELEILEPLVATMLLYDFYKFLRDNPYESLDQNHHFRRTRDILIARKVLY